MAHISADSILRQLRQPGALVIAIGQSDTAWNPASTSRVISGPASLTYRSHADGGILLQVGEAPQVGPRPPLRIRNTAPRSR